MTAKIVSQKNNVFYVTKKKTELSEGYMLIIEK